MYIDGIDANEIKNLPARDFYDFLHDKYFVWKCTQPNRLATTRMSLEKYIDEDKLSERDEIHKGLFIVDRNDIETCLQTVMKIKGLGTGGASGLLAILFPKYFGTVDQFLVRALMDAQILQKYNGLQNTNPDSIKKKEGVLLIEILRQKASELNLRFSTDFWTPRRIDMILWSIGRF